MMHEFIVISVITVVCFLIVLPAFLFPLMDSMREEQRAHIPWKVERMALESLLAQCEWGVELPRDQDEMDGLAKLEAYERVMNRGIK